ncbi:citrate/2-methylcitrate synthase [Actinomadura oligospora]|uniref:citrate/2-methylcitrate synthase n=1 Tax=Actinomadura oligospora TaxID=111804 RepID=UPI000479BDDA|nr:citrate/2-methylcitrate synthase [Actinomadura oligospora]
MGEWIDAAAAAERLGVKPATLYAYVSRGVLRRRRDEAGRRSLFDAAQVEELARKGRPRRGPAPSELAIESSVTALGPDRPYYRGRDALALATGHPFEAVAEWLWTGDPASLDTVSLEAASQGWRAPEEGLRAARAAQSGLPSGILPLDRLQVITTALAVTDPLRVHIDPEGVLVTARSLIAGLVDALPPVTGPADDGGRGTIAGRLWRALCPDEPSPGLLRAFEAAMVLLADHELAASTLAARVAASVRADPYAVVTAGLGVVSGPLHGGASYAAERLFAEVGEPGRAPRVIGDRLRAGERIPGFGHPVYKSGDGRATVLLGLVRDAAPGHPRVAVADAVLAEAKRRRLPEPNIDFALALLGGVAGLVPGAGEAVFAVARVAGWLAHALEEYGGRSPLRPRAVYVGPPLPD